MSLRILVTGSREWRDRDAIRAALVEALGDFTTIGAPVLVHGGQVSHDPKTGEQYGADYLAGEVWRELADARPGWLAKPEVYPADWAAPCTDECQPGHRRRNRNSGDYCPAAGIRRNQRMIDAGADVCLAFPAFPLASSRGTWDCVRRAQAVPMPVRLAHEHGWSSAEPAGGNDHRA